MNQSDLDLEDYLYGDGTTEELRERETEARDAYVLMQDDGGGADFDAEMAKFDSVCEEP